NPSSATPAGTSLSRWRHAPRTRPRKPNATRRGRPSARARPKRNTAISCARSAPRPTSRSACREPPVPAAAAAERPRIALTAGEPAGIGPELLGAISAGEFAADLVFIGNAELLIERALADGRQLALDAHDAGTPVGKSGRIAVID